MSVKKWMFLDRTVLEIFEPSLRDGRRTPTTPADAYHSAFPLTGSPPIGGLAKRHTTKIRPKAVWGGIFSGFFRTSINADRK